MIYADLVAFNYGYTLDYIEEMLALNFLKFIRCIQKREAEEHLLEAHINCMQHADEEGWNNFKVSLGFAPKLSELAIIASQKQETDLKALQSLKAFMGEV